MERALMEIGREWLESRGKSKPARRYMFEENEIVSVGYPRQVSSLWNATYLNLHPTHYAIAIGPDGRLINLKGGYNQLPSGNYTVHFVDKQNRVKHLPRITGTTYDGSQLALELVITYRVLDPIKALEVQQAVETLAGFIQSDVKEFIRSHRYDEIVGDIDGRKMDNEQVTRYIREQHASRHQMSRLFMIADVVVKEMIGDTKLTEIREKYQIDQRQFAARTELQRQNQELEKKVTSQEAAIRQIKVQAEASLLELTQKMERQKIELENERAQLQYQQEKWMRAIDAIADAFASPGFPRDPQVIDIVRQLLAAMGASPGRMQEAMGGRTLKEPAAATQSVDSLTDMLRSLNNRKPF